MLYLEEFPVFLNSSPRCMACLSAEATHSKHQSTNPKKCSPNIAPKPYSAAPHRTALHCAALHFTALHMEQPTPSRRKKITHLHIPGQATGPPAKPGTHGARNSLAQDAGEVLPSAYRQALCHHPKAPDSSCACEVSGRTGRKGRAECFKGEPILAGWARDGLDGEGK